MTPNLDSELPNSIRHFQTVERIRQKWPKHDWSHLMGMLHDVGKVLASLDQRAVVGDTFLVGCAPDEACVFGWESSRENPDASNPVYGTECGMYELGCGIPTKLTMS